VQRSTNRILTTHVGSLIRPKDLLDDYLLPLQRGEHIDEAGFQTALKRTVNDVVKAQEKAGVDVVSDGEFGKAYSWSQYVLTRLDGFEKRTVDIKAGEKDPFEKGADRERFRAFYDELDGKERTRRSVDVVCTAPIKYTGHAEVQRDIEDFKAALAKSNVTEGFLPVAAPASVIPDRRNEYYKTDEELVYAIADAMREEYKAIIDAGLLVQIDDARAAVTYDRMVPPGTMKDFRKWLKLYMDALNYAIKGLPEEKIRYHVCWGSWPGPHTTDVPWKDIADMVLGINCGAYVLEMANPRHEHEWNDWRTIKLPKGRVLIPGVISHATNIVEHPELVKERIVRVANLVGRENVIAGTDCGFAQAPTAKRVHESIQWAKLEALAEGAALASKELWKKSPKKTAAKKAVKKTAKKSAKTAAKKATKKVVKKITKKVVKKKVAKKSRRR
jgi:5-methyltetrahydropteroyltriglutamate--homocysteine methyltransferase